MLFGKTTNIEADVAKDNGKSLDNYLDCDHCTAASLAYENEPLSIQSSNEYLAPVAKSGMFSAKSNVAAFTPSDKGSSESSDVTICDEGEKVPYVQTVKPPIA